MRPGRAAERSSHRLHRGQGVLAAPVGCGILAACLLLSTFALSCTRDSAAPTAPAATAAGPQGGEGGGAAAPTTPARLLRGPEPRKGLPFFGPNALPALRGEYGLGGVVVTVWSCREKVVFGAAWKQAASDSGPRLKAWLLDRAQGPVLALVAEGYVLFFELPEDAPAYRRFALALESRFQLFFQNAVSDAELSLPAYVDFKP